MIRNEHPDHTAARQMTVLDEQAQRDERAELIARHTPPQLLATRTGEVKQSTVLLALVDEILDAHVPSAIKLDAAHALARLLKDAAP